MASLQSTTVAATGNLQLPSGTTAQRPASPSAGMTRYNTDLSYVEVYNGSSWNSLVPAVVGENFATITSASGSHVQGIKDGYRIHNFLSGSHTFTPTRTGYVEVLVVAGGGGGSNYNSAGGGGAGGLLYNAAFSVTKDTAYTVTVGAGGNGAIGAGDASTPATSGSNSVFGSLTAIGGGNGGQGNAYGGTRGSSDVSAGTGGSGGGVRWSSGLGTGGAAGTTGQGFRGGHSGTYADPYPGGGGGGAGGPGGDGADNIRGGGVGGPGLQFNISGTPTWYAGGGGGSTQGGGSATNGGVGGGGAGGGGTLAAAQPDGLPGIPNTGGGGGGGGGIGVSGSNSPASYGGVGGSGIVILRYYQ